MMQAPPARAQLPTGGADLILFMPPLCFQTFHMEPSCTQTDAPANVGSPHTGNRAGSRHR